MTTTLLHPQGDYDLAKAESSRLPGLAAGTGRRGRGHLDSAPSFLDESSGQSLTQCWPKQLEYLCMRRQEARGATHWSWIQDRQMILDDAAPMRLTRVMYSVTAMHWGSSGMESEQLDLTGPFPRCRCSLFGCECPFKGRDHGGQKSQGKAPLER